MYPNREIGYSNLESRELVRRYYQPLLRFAFSLARNEHDASDLTQQTFAIWAEKGSSLHDPGKIKTWLFTVLYREFLRLHRYRTRMATLDPDILDDATSESPSDLDTSMDAVDVRNSLSQMSDAFKKPIMLFYLKGLSYKETAAACGIPIGTVMSRLSRGKARLKAILHNQYRTHDRKAYASSKGRSCRVTG